MRARRKKRIRKSTKYIGIIISIFFIMFSSSNLVNLLSNQNIGKKTEEIYSYINAFNYNYKVNLINNKYMTNNQIEQENMSYVTDLIDTIDLMLDYTYNAEINSEIEYKYKVIGKMEASYTQDGEEQKVWEKEDGIIDEKAYTVDSKQVSINEQITLDLKELNELIKEFEQEMGMNLDAIYVVVLQVETKTTIQEQEVKNTYSTGISIELANKTTRVEGEKNKEDIEYVSKEVDAQEEQNVFFVIMNIVIFIIGLYILYYVLKAKTTNRVKNEYRQELNKILRICQDKIVQTKSRPEIDMKNIVEVKDFAEIIKVSEELFKPILYWSNNEKEEAWFIVMSNQVSYRYILKGH